MNAIDIGKRIHQRMEALELNNEELARRLKVSPSHLSRVRSGKAGDMRFSVVQAWARVLGVTPQWLFEGEGPEFREACARLGADRDISAALVAIASWFHTSTESEREVLRHNFRLLSEQLSRRDTHPKTWTIDDVVDREALRVS